MIDDRITALKEFIFSEIRESKAVPEEVSDKELDGFYFHATSNLRLRFAGYIILGSLFDHEKFPLEDKLTGRELLTLKNHVQWPYYLPVNHLYVSLFTIKQSFLLKLQGGDVKRWLAQIYEKNS